MIMDSHFREYDGSISGTNLSDDAVSVLSDLNLVNEFKFEDGFKNETFLDLPLLPSVGPGATNLVQSSRHEGELHDDFDFSDVVLKYINQMLMEEDMEEKNCMFQESSATIQAAEKSFYEALGEKYPLLTDHLLMPVPDPHIESPDEHYTANFSECNNSFCCNSNNLADHGWNCKIRDYQSCHIQNTPLDVTSLSTSQSSFSSSSSGGHTVDAFVDSPLSSLRVTDIFSDKESVLQFHRGVEEASKFLPNNNGLFANVKSNGLLPKERKEEAKTVIVEVGKHDCEDYSDGSRGRKNPHPQDVDLESGRITKQSAVYSDSTLRTEMFDKVLLCGGEKDESALWEALQHGGSKNLQQNGQFKGSNGGKARGKKQGGKRDVVDLRTLLTLCAQSVASDDWRSTNELLKQIRQHSSPMGDGMQRMASYFADGLEARLAGCGTQVYTSLLHWQTSAADILKAYHLFLTVCPFRKLSNFFSNKTIMNVAEKTTRLHIIDFGILYGFQWPCLIQRLSSRPGGPPKLRITGIDFPRPGFRPLERVEETGRRLANYAESFNVPFEFNAIAQKWETIQIEDIKIDNDEVLVVNCLYRMRNLLDETVMLESPRNIVLNLIKKMNPHVFIQGIINGTYSAPFFITRFREAIFHYSAWFDMLETTVPRGILERMLIEKEIIGRGAMNVIACEGAERIERPETYKQWQVRNLRAGFRQLLLNQEIMSIAKEKVASGYHKDFVIDEDGQWLLQGWKGRILYAISSWKPVH